jgi:hypothetical protein
MLFFYKTGEQEGKTGPFVGDGTSEKSGGYKRIGSEGKYVANILYTCM